MDDQWKIEIERSIGYLAEALDDLMRSDAVQRHPESALRKLADARELLGNAIDSWEPEGKPEDPKSS